MYSTTPSSSTRIVSPKDKPGNTARHTIWDSSLPCYCVPRRSSANCLSSVHSMTHPTLRSKTTRKSAAIGGNATSALFDLSWTAMLCNELGTSQADQLESRSPSMSSAGRGRACGVWYHDPLPSPPLLPPRHVTLFLYNHTTTDLKSLRLLRPTRVSILRWTLSRAIPRCYQSLRPSLDIRNNAN